MKKLANLKDVKMLNKKEQKILKGGNQSGNRCLNIGSWCCITTASQEKFCGIGSCLSNGNCSWY